MNEPAHEEVVLQIGDFYFGGGRTRVRTLLGSCVAIVLWHPRLHIGGMCHYLLPRRGATEVAQRAGEGSYAEGAMRLFMRELQRTRTQPHEYVAKIFGGGCMFNSTAAGAPDPLGDEQGVAMQNIQVGYELLRQYGFTIAAEQLGGLGSRMVVFELWSGDVWIRRGDPLGMRSIA
jgi:chemotaxis protein CheD